MEKLRAGLEIENVPHDLSVILGDSESDGGIKDGKLLIEFAEAIVSRDAQSLSAARDKIVATMGLESLVDAAAVAGAFQGLDRIANGTALQILLFDKGFGLLNWTHYCQFFPEASQLRPARKF